MLQIEVILKFEEMCLESAKEFSAWFAQVCLWWDDVMIDIIVLNWCLFKKYAIILSVII